MKLIDVLQAGYKNPDYGNLNFMQLISNQRGKIFNFSYPIDPSIKQDFEEQFILHFLNYELAFCSGESTMTWWQIELAQRLNQMFPLYNQFITRLQSQLTGANENVSRETYKKDNQFNSDRNNSYNSNRDGTGKTDSTGTGFSKEDNSSEHQESRKNRDFPNSAVSDTDKYMTDSYDLNYSDSGLINRNDSNTVNQTSTTKDTIADTGNEKIADTGTEDFTRDKTDTQGISDLDFIMRFRTELLGLYDEIFKYCVDLFIFAW